MASTRAAAAAHVNQLQLHILGPREEAEDRDDAVKVGRPESSCGGAGQRRGGVHA